MSVVWDRVGPGRYATTVNGRVLQAMRNPDWTDGRRYIAVVDKKPLETPDWNLSGAKSRAIRAVLFDGHGRRKAEMRTAAVERQSEAAPVLEPAAELVPVLAPELGRPAAETATLAPLSDLAPYADFAEVEPPVDAGRTVTATFTVELPADDVAAAIVNLRSMAELLREQGRVMCTVDLPPRIEL